MNNAEQLIKKSFQGKTEKELEELISSYNTTPGEKIPILTKFIVGLAHERLGCIQEANEVLLSLYRCHNQGTLLWSMINDFRIVHGNEFSDGRPKILTNLTEGRIDLSLKANADIISFTPGANLGRQSPSVITYRILQDTFLDILSQCPPKWEPDHVLIFLSEAHPLLHELEKSPFPVIGLPGDPWRLSKAFCDVAFFDAVMPAIKRLCPAYESFGKIKTLYTSNSGIQGYVPWGFTSCSHNKEKEFDIVTTGNLSSCFYRKRGRYTWRLLKLANRYKVFAGRVNSLDECYTIMNKAKIVIHCPSIQGGVNLRPFEAVACGALLFHDECDRSIEEFFVPDKEVVLFNEDNLEQKIEYYLNNDAERERIIRQATEKNNNYCDIVSLMKNTIEKIKQSKVSVTPRMAGSLTIDRKFNALGISGFDASMYNLAEFRFSEALKINGQDVKYHNNLAVCLMVQAIRTKETDSRIESLLLTAYQSNKPTIVSLFNLISFYLFIRFNQERFLTLSNKLIHDITGKNIELPVFSGDELLFNLEIARNQAPTSSVFLIELEELWVSFPDLGVQHQEGFIKTIFWRTLEYRGDYYEKLGEGNAAVCEYKKALACCPQNEFILEKLSRLLLDAGQLDDAKFYLSQLLQLSPMHEDAHLWLSKIEEARGEREKTRERISCLLHVTGLKHQGQFNRILERSLYE